MSMLLIKYLNITNECAYYILGETELRFILNEFKAYANCNAHLHFLL